MTLPPTANLEVVRRRVAVGVPSGGAPAVPVGHRGVVVHAHAT